MALVPRHGEGAYLCLDHVGAGEPGAIDIAPGECQVCRQPLAAARTAAVYDCPGHGRLGLPGPGECPLCQKGLVLRSAAVAWRCPEHRNVTRIEEGACPTCAAPLERTLVDLPHGDHNPRHGGVFFMARDRWHHLEGTVPELGLFRLHLYDNFTRPMGPAGVSGHLQRVRVNADGMSQLDEAHIPLVSRGEVLEARVPDMTLPFEAAAFIRFRPQADGGAPDRFDFHFARLSSAPGTPPPAPARPQLVIPAEPAAILEAAAARLETLKSLLAGRRLTEMYAPALEAKDLILELLERPGAIDPFFQPRAQNDGTAFVRAAWQVDLHGDAGDLEKTRAALAAMEAALKSLTSCVKASPVND
jgi:hypothetical protein